MGQLLLFVVVALVVAAIVFGVTVMVSGGDSGLTPVEPDGRALPLPSDRPLGEEDVVRTRFDTAFRGYRMSQVDQALQRAAYDIGYKGELIGVLEAEVTALREGRTADADVLRRAREAAVAPPSLPPGPVPDDPISVDAEPTVVAEPDVPPAEPSSSSVKPDVPPAKPSSSSVKPDVPSGEPPTVAGTAGAASAESSAPAPADRVEPAGDEEPAERR
ncbi:DivIVA domain-containing protein [Actinoplanes sp. NPDC051346]|uniref:DivIVA domain-containing protein n=1 Tax=Actinoplanes sp. NPDC051346 TaxID=3155048 RepID=UPI003432A998